MVDAVKIAPTVTWLAPCAMIALRADPETDGAAIAAATGVAMPGQRRITVDGDRALAWMSPDELLVMAPKAEAAAMLAALDDALAGRHHLAVDLSDARARFRIDGPGAREVIAKGAPVDMASPAFRPVEGGAGDFRRSRLGQIAAAFWMPGDDVVELVCFRSVAGYAEAWLRQASRAGSLPGVL
jgi:sarcosine oxidase subunit gamma